MSVKGLTTHRMEPVAITGMGCISALGNDVDMFAESLFNGKDGAAPITLFDNPVSRVRVAAEVAAFDPLQHFNKKAVLPFMDRFAQFSVVSARQAVAHAGLDKSLLRNPRTAVVFATGIGGQETQDLNFHRLYAEGARRLHPSTVPKLIPSAATSHVTVDLGIVGPGICTASACAASGHAIIMAAMLIQTGQADRVVCGGGEAPINFGCMKAWEGMRVLTPDVCSPFSIKRSGVLLGEGAASLVVESLVSARERGATVLATLEGYGMSSDASSFVAPTVAGPVQAMTAALKHAGITPSDVAHVNAHGSGTLQNDPKETIALHEVFGSSAEKLRICASKSMHGHLLGAASALEAIATITALTRQTSPPTINYRGLDPDCDLNYTASVAQSFNGEFAMSNSFAFGGLNTSLVFKRA